MNDKPLSYSAKAAVSIHAGAKFFHSGVKIIDLTFPSIVNPESLKLKLLTTVPKELCNLVTYFEKSQNNSTGKDNEDMCEQRCFQVGEIRLQNHYVAFLSIKAKMKSAPDDSVREGGSSGVTGWKVVLRRYRLMPCPHSETGSQDCFSFSRKHFSCDLHHVISLRLILQQPSPVWNDFKIEDIKLFRNSPGIKAQPLPTWVLEDEKGKTPMKKEIEGVPDLDVLSSNLQQLWALAEEVSANQTEQSVGRYEVDGCYDINLLAYS